MVPLILAPIALVIIARFPKAAIVVFAPVSLFAESTFGGTIGSRAPLAILVVVGFGLLTKRWRANGLFHGTLVAYSALLLVSLVYSRPSPLGLSAKSDCASLIIGLGLCGAAACIRPRVEHVIWAIAVACLAASIVALSGSFQATNATLDVIDLNSVTRITALGLNPNYLGIMFAIGVVAFVGLAIQYRNPFVAIGAIPILFALPTVKSRSAYVLIIVGLLAVLLVGRAWRTRTVVIIGILLSLVAAPSLIGVTYHATLGNRNEITGSQSDELRFSASRLGAEVAFDHPLLGVGYGNFPSFAASNPSMGVPLNTHDDYLRMAAEAGIPTMMLLLLLLGMAFNAMRKIRFGTPAIAILATYAVALLTANTLSSLAVTSGVWILIGASFGANESQRLSVSDRDRQSRKSDDSNGQLVVN